MMRSLYSERRGDGLRALSSGTIDEGVAWRGERSRERTLSAVGPCSGRLLPPVAEGTLLGWDDSVRRGDGMGRPVATPPRVGEAPARGEPGCGDSARRGVVEREPGPERRLDSGRDPGRDAERESG